MKRFFILFAAAAMALASCGSNNDVSEDKLDLTKSYQSAALALADAQNNYNEALASHDSTRIATAKNALQEATQKYVQSKNSLVAKGGTVNAQYEQYLSKSKQTLALPVSAATSQKQTSTAGSPLVDSAVSHLVGTKGQSVQKAITGGTSKVSNTVKSLQEQKAKSQASLKKAEADILKKKTDAANAKKNFQDQVEKTKKDLNSLLH